MQGRDAELPRGQLDNGEAFAARLASILFDHVGAWNHVGGGLIRLQCQAVRALGAFVACELDSLALAWCGHFLTSLAVEVMTVYARKTYVSMAFSIYLSFA